LAVRNIYKVGTPLAQGGGVLRIRMNNKIVLMCSGGIDSSSAAFAYVTEGLDVYPLFVNYGQRARRMEQQAVVRICASSRTRRPKIVEINELGQLTQNALTDRKSTVHLFPFRNLILATIGAIYGHDLGCRTVAMGFHRELSDECPDTTARFRRAASAALRSSLGQQVALVTPFHKLWKAEVVKWATDAGVPLGFTYSCYSGTRKHCGRCLGCRKRHEAFTAAGLVDPTEYLRKPS